MTLAMNSMNWPSRVSSLRPIFASAILAVGVWCAEGALAQTPPEPPPALVSLPAPWPVTSLSTATKTVSYTFNTLDPWVKLTWRTRQDTSSPWVTASKKYPASFFITDAQPLCDHDFFVAGVYADGNSTIEQWTWGLNPRDPYQERRTVLYRGTSLGHIRSVSPDPQGRFILILTHENAGVYQRSLPSGSPVLLFDKNSVPDLQQMMRLYPVDHVTQGRKFKFSRYRPSQDRRSINGPAVLLPDANNDGVFDPPVVVTSAQWVALGYDQPGIWSYPAICH